MDINLNAGIGLLIVEYVARYLLKDRISQRLHTTGITSSAVEENEIQLLDPDRAICG
jgi:hypothetical protein